MRIMIINTFYYPNIVGGTENSIKILAENLVENGHEVAVLTCDSENSEKKELINGVTIYRALACKQDKKIKKAINYKSKYDLLDKVLNEFKPDIVNTNNIYGFHPYIWKRIKNHNCKLVHTIRDYWTVCPRGSLLDNKNNRCIQPKTKCKIWRSYFRFFSKYVDSITAPSQYTINNIINKNYFVNKRAVCIHNCIDFDELKVKEIINDRINKNDNKIKFMFIGNLLKIKGIEILIENFKKIRNNNINLILCGDGELKAYVEEQCKIDSRIIYLGRVSGKQKEEVFEKSDVLIIPSIWDEPFGRVILEAYKSGLPVIGSNYGGIPEVIDNNTGIIIDPNNESEMIRSIEYLCDRNNIKSFVDNIPKKICEFTVENNVKEYERLFNSI